MEPEGSLLSLQYPTTGPYPVYTLKSYVFYIHFNIIPIYVFLVVTFRVFLLTPIMRRIKNEIKSFIYIYNLNY
jgi:hypothetical protein